MPRRSRPGMVVVLSRRWFAMQPGPSFGRRVRDVHRPRCRRPHLEILEDRLTPGEFLLASALGPSLLGPSLLRAGPDLPAWPPATVTGSPAGRWAELFGGW